MRKIVIFNVGGALSAYAEVDDKKIVVDLGSNSEFSPVNNFLYSLAKQRNFETAASYASRDEDKSKYSIDQLFISHLDNDHISDYENFRKYFHPRYMTCPNDNKKQEEIYMVKTNYYSDDNKSREFVLEDMRSRTTDQENPYGMSYSNPLVSTISEINLFYIVPEACESEEELKLGYNNNISLVLFFCFGNKTLLMPGDILKEGMSYLIENNPSYKSLLTTLGIDFLVAPHHGLSTSFPEELFQTMNGSKTRLNIISEKTRSEDSDENRSNVDMRYYSADYSTSDNSLKQYGVKTSMGHIVIDFDTEETEIKQLKDIQDVINEFSL